MKLIFCPKCQDIFRLTKEVRICLCGSCWGVYTDKINAKVSSEAIVLGIANNSFRKAVKNRMEFDLPNGQGGVRFDAFVIPKKVKSIKVVQGGREDKGKVE